MDLGDLLTLQGTLFLLMLLGAYLTKKGVITKEGKRCLTDLVVYVILPCTIFKSCFVDTGTNFAAVGALLLLLSLVIEVGSLFFNQVLYRRLQRGETQGSSIWDARSQQRFLGTPIAEGVYHDLGVLYAAIFLIPVRIFMWSFGTSYFMAQEGMSKRSYAERLLPIPASLLFSEPCCHDLRINLPSVLKVTVLAISKCNSAIAMFVVGTVLAEAPTWKIFDLDTVYYCVIRLIFLPLLTLFLGRVMGLSGASLGVAVLMMGMPAGATTSIFPSLYGGDARLGTSCVILSVLLSMVTLPLWIYLVHLS